MMAPAALRNTTVQPAGKASVEKLELVLAARSKVSDTPLVLLTNSVKRVVVPGPVVLVVCAAPSGPAPTPTTPPPPMTALPVRSTELAAMAVKVSLTVAVLVGSSLEVAVLLTENGPPVELVGSVARSTTLYVAPLASVPVSGTPLPLVSSSGVKPSAW